MADLDRFEARLTVALERLADEAPTDVDALALAEAVAARNRRGGRLPAAVADAWRDAATLRVLLVVLVLLALLYAAAVLARPARPASPAPLSHGSADCGAGWGNAVPDAGVRLTCRATMSDPLLSGRLVIDLGGGSSAAGVGGRTGRVEIEGDGITWSGPLVLALSVDGPVAGDAILSSDAGGAAIHLHLVTAGGTRWGLLAWPAGTP